MASYSFQMSLSAKKKLRRYGGAAMTMAALLGAALLTTSCSSGKPARQSPALSTGSTQSTTTTPPGRSSSGTTGQATPTTPVGTRSCTPSDVAIFLGQGEGAAGSEYYPIEFLSNSWRACQLRGFPDVAAYGAASAERQIGRAAVRDYAEPVRTVILKPGGTAHSTLQVVNVGNYPPETCRPVTATWIKVDLPNQTVVAYTPHQLRACLLTGPQFLRVRAIEAGP
jgi:hypothetical protein